MAVIRVVAFNVLHTNMECAVYTFSVVNGYICEILKIDLLEVCSSRNKKREENAAVPD